MIIFAIFSTSSGFLSFLFHCIHYLNPSRNLQWHVTLRAVGVWSGYYFIVSSSQRLATSRNSQLNPFIRSGASKPQGLHLSSNDSLYIVAMLSAINATTYKRVQPPGFLDLPLLEVFVELFH